MKKIIVIFFLVLFFLPASSLSKNVFAHGKRTFYPVRVSKNSSIKASTIMAQDARQEKKEQDPVSQVVEDENQTKKIKLYTFYTPSHQILKDKWFLPSLKDENIELIMHKYPQECPSAKVFSFGWQAAMLRKVDMIIGAIQDNWDDIFIYSDIDIQFFNPISEKIKKALKYKDMVIQRDTPSGTMCAGFLACRANDRTLNLWHEVRAYMIKNNSPSDQKTLNKLLREEKKNKFNIRWDYLPTEFCGGGTFLASCWRPGKRMFVPRNIVLHHANWTRGIEHKIEQLKYVQKRVR